MSDILIHIVEDLDDQGIHELERDVSEINGVTSACVNEKTRHLMVVDYDHPNVRSHDILGRVESHGFHAELVGL